MKKMIEKQIEIYVDINTSIDNLLKEFNKLKDQYGKDAQFELDGSSYDCYDYSFTITYKIEESDKAYEKRIDANKKRQITRKINAKKNKLKKIENEKAKLKELLEKYGTDV